MWCSFGPVRWRPNVIAGKASTDRQYKRFSSIDGCFLDWRIPAPGKIRRNDRSNGCGEWERYARPVKVEVGGLRSSLKLEAWVLESKLGGLMSDAGLKVPKASVRCCREGCHGKVRKPPLLNLESLR